ncbi:unnamed protein product [Anisakis simplex]|uniref:Secreted protein n=1 Tax=Anisakis simplex TaxID=6269 RepID=A0A0M3J7G2_ANISI|nr:unnamed protein product [Anisakis simplex]
MCAKRRARRWRFPVTLSILSVSIAMVGGLLVVDDNAEAAAIELTSANGTDKTDNGNEKIDNHNNAGADRQRRSYANCFGTEKFLLVGYANCHLTTERSPPPGMCPYHTLYQLSTYSHTQWDCANVRMHLLIGDNERPRVLIIGSSRDSGN